MKRPYYIKERQLVDDRLESYRLMVKIFGDNSKQANIEYKALQRARTELFYKNNGIYNK